MVNKIGMESLRAYELQSQLHEVDFEYRRNKSIRIGWVLIGGHTNNMILGNLGIYSTPTFKQRG